MRIEKAHESSKVLNVGLVSFEFGSLGGIGTYSRNAARMLSGIGHSVGVFTTGEEGTSSSHGLTVYLTDASNREVFREAAAAQFATRHLVRPFDVVEVPEYAAEGAGIAAAFPELPMVVRLHTPRFVMSEIWHSYLGWGARARFLLGALRRGRRPEKLGAPIDSTGEREATRAADLVVGPSRAILDLVGDRWKIPHDARMVVPNVFIPPPELVALDPARVCKTVLYVGRLEVRKGVLDLADAVPLVCEIDPSVRFVFLGRSLPLPHKRHDTRTEMLARVGRWKSSVTFVDAVPYSDVPSFFANADIAVFPSIWENFPNVCLEAMAAGCGVIGSSAGGMAEIIDDGRTGLLVPPRDPSAIANRILTLLSDPARRRSLGCAARQHVLDSYSEEKIGPLQEASYHRAIALARQRSGKAGE